MNLPFLHEDQTTAREKWREYSVAFKQTHEKVYDDLRIIYHKIKSGCQIIDIDETIRTAGLRPETGLPYLAIAPALAKIIFASYNQDGTMFYSGRSHWKKSWRDYLHSWEFEVKGFTPIRRRLQLNAPVPIIPPRLRPAKMDGSYYILWEVDAWKMQVSKDPYLLRRVRGNIMTVVAGWDLTEIEARIFNSLIAK